MFGRGDTSRSGGAFDPSQTERSDLGAHGQELAAEPPPKQHLLDRALFIAWALVCFSVTFTQPENEEGSRAVEALWGFAYLVAIAGIVVERKTAIRLMRASLPLILILVVAGLSTLWSDAPGIAARRSVALLGTSLVALSLVCRLGLKGFIETIGLLFMLVAAWSAALIVLLPEYGITPDRGWKGFFENKNELGLNMVLGMVMFSCVGDGSHGIRRIFQIAALPLFLVLVIGSGSATSFIVAVTLALLFLLALWSRARQSAKPALLGALVLSAAALAAILSGIGQNEAFGALGRDATLTGRTEIWPRIIDAIGARPLLGYGHGVFWSPEGPGGPETSMFADWYPGVAHNGFLEVALYTGMLGEAALIFFLVIGLTRAAAAFWEGRDRSSAWPLFAMLFVILTNLTETSFERVNSFHWVVLVAAFFFSIDAWQRRAVLERRSRKGELDAQIAFRSTNPIQF